MADYNNKTEMAKRLDGEKAAIAAQLANSYRYDKAPEPLQPSMTLFGQLNNMLVNLTNYSTNLIRKYPRDQKWQAGLAAQIMIKIDEAIQLINEIAIYNPAYDREAGFRRMCVLMRTINCYIESSYRHHFITGQNWQGWVKQTVAIDNLSIRMAMYLQGRKKAAKSASSKTTTRRSQTN